MKQFGQFIKEVKKEDRDYNKVISEAFSTSNIDKVNQLVSRYFKRNLGTDVSKMPGVEDFFNTSDRGFGVRFFMSKEIGGFDSIRFNWRNKSKVGSAEISSVDVFGRGKHKYHLEFEAGTSIIKILPFVKDFVKKPQSGSISFLSESMLTESTDTLVSKLVDFSNKTGEDLVARGRIKSIISDNFSDEKPAAARKLADALRKVAPELVVRDGKREKFDISGMMKHHDAIMDAVFVNVKVTSGSKKETYTVDPEVEKMEQQGIERLSFEQQLKDMQEAVRLLWSNVTNAVFIGGRGGIGKTHNVEEILNDELGLEDGNGYYKNAGSISASGLYRMLYRHRDSLIMFDDSDSVFGDQEARNILKGATDTKPKRKIAWSKKSSDIIHPDNFTDEDEEEGKVPSFFEFTGKILFISNLKMDKLDPDGALRTRGIMIEINPTDEEVYQFMRKIAPNMPLADGLSLSDEQRIEVVDVLESNPKKVPNLRTLVRGLNIRAGASASMDWKNFVLRYA